VDNARNNSTGSGAMPNPEFYEEFYRKLIHDTMQISRNNYLYF